MCVLVDSMSLCEEIMKTKNNIGYQTYHGIFCF